MELQYSYQPKDETRIAKAMGRDLDISFKSAVVVCDKLRGMQVSSAITLLESVTALERSIPYNRFQSGVGHRKGTDNGKVGKYPKKVSLMILSVLRNLEKNSDFKGLATEDLKIIHVQAQKGISRSKRKPKGRYKLRKTQLVTIQVIAKENKKKAKAPQKPTAKKEEKKAAPKVKKATEAKPAEKSAPKKEAPQEPTAAPKTAPKKAPITEEKKVQQKSVPKKATLPEEKKTEENKKPKEDAPKKAEAKSQ